MPTVAQAVPDAGIAAGPGRTQETDGARQTGTTSQADQIGAQGSARDGTRSHAQPETGAAAPEPAAAQATATDAPAAVAASAQPLSPAAFPPVEVQKAGNAAPSTTAGSGAGDATRAGGSAGDATPTAQVAGPVVKLLQAADGSSSMSVSLHPKDLGEVKIRLDRDTQGSVRVVVAATEPATLRSLMADQSHLHAALDAASLPAGDRQFSFELANGSPGTAGGQENAAQAGSGDSGQRQGGRQAPQDQGSSAAWNADRVDQAAALPAFMTSAASYRAGVNITA